MIGIVVAALGYLLLVAGIVALAGPWALVAGGALMLAVGLVVDLDPVKEPQRGKRSQSAP